MFQCREPFSPATFVRIPSGCFVIAVILNVSMTMYIIFTTSVQCTVVSDIKSTTLFLSMGVVKKQLRNSLEDGQQRSLSIGTNFTAIANLPAKQGNHGKSPPFLRKTNIQQWPSSVRNYDDDGLCSKAPLSSRRDLLGFIRNFSVAARLH